MTRRLELVFDDCTAFRAEYEQNIARGGAFIATPYSFEMREPVEVELVLAFCNESIPLEAEVVHSVSADEAGPDGAGVAVQFTCSAGELRGQLEGYLSSGAAEAPSDEVPLGNHERENDLVDFEASAGQGDLLFSGPETEGAADDDALIDLGDADTLVSLGSADTQPGPDAAPEIQARLDEAAQAVAASSGRALSGGIAGVIEELGVASLVQMFGTAGARGTLTFVSGERVGLIGLDAGKLQGAEVGDKRGVVALARMLSFEEGLFHYRGELDESLAAQEPVALEGAILEAVHQIDEVARNDTLDLEATLVLDAESLNGRLLSTTEEAVVELAEAGFSIARLVEVIPEPDAQVLEAVRALLDAGVVSLSRG